jgi:hypothetical protein
MSEFLYQLGCVLLMLCRWVSQEELWEALDFEG